MAAHKKPKALHKVAFTISMSPALLKQVNALARREGRTRSNLVEHAVRQYTEALKVAA